MVKISKSAKQKIRIVIVGADLQGHGGVVINTLKNTDKYEIVGYIDNVVGRDAEKMLGIPFLGRTDDLDSMELPNVSFHIAIGDNFARQKVFALLKKLKRTFANIVHPSAVVAGNCLLGEGCFIGAGTVIGNDVRLGDAVILESSVVIDHNTTIGAAVFLASGSKISGRAKIDDFAFIGIGASVLPDVHIGSGVMVGAGSTVVKNVASKTTVKGYSAKKHTKNIYIDAKADVPTPTGKIYVAQPSLPDYSLIDEKFRDIANSLILSNFAKYSSLLEEDVENRLKVKKALSFPNCTSALMLALKAMELEGEVILPSFTFSSTGHAVVWNGLTPVFADIDPETFCVDPDDVEKKITEKTSAIIGVHVFGNPANIKRLEEIAAKHKLKLIFDSAHALGSMYHGQPIGSFGDIECFSLSGTKVITSAEGGLATSNNEKFMQTMHLGRNYGADADYDCQYIGLNGKMSEFHAAIALESMALVDKFLAQRNHLAELYVEKLSKLPGLSFQHIPEGHVSTFKDFAVIVDQKAFGLSRDQIVDRLIEQGIYPKKYFFPLHRMKAYQSVEHRAKGLKNTEYVADNIICLPIFSHMNEEMLNKICNIMSKIREAVSVK